MFCQNHAILVTATFLYESIFKLILAILAAMFAAILNSMPSKTVLNKSIV